MLSTNVFSLTRIPSQSFIIFRLLVNSYSLTPSDLHALLQRPDDSHQALVIDIRSLRRYHHGHIPNTHHIPSGNLVSGELPDSDLVLVSDDERSVQQLTDTLYDAGFHRRILYLQGGIQSWRQSGRSLQQKESSANSHLALKEPAWVAVITGLFAFFLVFKHASTLLIGLTLFFSLLLILLILFLQRPDPQLLRRSA